MKSSQVNEATKVTRSYVKYRLNNDRVFNKRRLVLAVVKDYMIKYPTVTADELSDTFGNIFKQVKTASSVQYFTEPKDVIKTSDRIKLAVYNQWTKNTFDKFVSTIRRIGYKVKLA